MVVPGFALGEADGQPVEQIYAGLGEHIKDSWSRSVVPSGTGYVSDEKYLTALKADRQELRRRLASIAFGQADALLFPTTPCAAPRIENQWKFQVGGKDVTEIFLSRNTHPSSSAGVPGISLPMEGFHSVSSSMRRSVVTVICSPWLAESNKSSGACPDTLGSKLQRMGSLTHIEGDTL